MNEWGPALVAHILRMLEDDNLSLSREDERKSGKRKVRHSHKKQLVASTDSDMKTVNMLSCQFCEMELSQ